MSADEAIVPDFVGNEDIGNDFRFVVTRYVFNLSTQGPGNPYPEIIIGPGVYTIYAVIDDGTVHSTPLHLKQ